MITTKHNIETIKYFLESDKKLIEEESDGDTVPCNNCVIRMWRSQTTAAKKQHDEFNCKTVQITVKRLRILLQKISNEARNKLIEDIAKKIYLDIFYAINVSTIKDDTYDDK